MQSDLREVSIQSFLVFLLKEQKSGVLSVEIPIKNIVDGQHKISRWSRKQAENKAKSSVSYPNFSVNTLYLLSGEITYSFDSAEYNFARLKDYLTYYQLESKVDEYLVNFQVSDYTQMEEYDCLIWLLQNKYLKPLQLKAITCKLIEETIFRILLYQRGTMTFQVDRHLHSTYHGKSTIKTIGKLEHNLRQWKQFSPHILSPDQFLHLEDRAYLKNTLSSKTYERLTEWTESQKSLLQLSRQLNCSLIHIGKVLYPYLQKGLLTLQTNHEVKIVDDLIF